LVFCTNIILERKIKYVMGLFRM